MITDLDKVLRPPTLIEIMMLASSPCFGSSLKGPQQGAHSDCVPGLASLLCDLPPDAFEPVPLREGAITRTASSDTSSSVALNHVCSNPARISDHQAMNKVLDQVLIEATDNSLMNTKLINDSLGGHFDEMPRDVFEPVPLKEESRGYSPFSKIRKQAPSSQMSLPAPSLKKRRTSSYFTPTIRGYQENQWMKIFDQLIEFKEQHGHCLVPHTYPENQTLSRWVKRQRYQYKLKQAGKESTMTDARVKMLQGIDFVWDSHAIIWEKRLNELKEYRNKYSDCNVPSNYDNQDLVVWIKCQRRQYRLFRDNNKSSSITIDRIHALNNIGFLWKVREDPPPVALHHRG